MGFDAKYGKVTTEHGDIPDDEPVFVLRARDMATVSTLQTYETICAALGSPQRHLDGIVAARRGIHAWQQEHQDRMKVPDSEASRAWMPDAPE